MEWHWIDPGASVGVEGHSAGHLGRSSNPGTGHFCSLVFGVFRIWGIWRIRQYRYYLILLSCVWGYLVLTDSALANHSLLYQCKSQGSRNPGTSRSALSHLGYFVFGVFGGSGNPGTTWFCPLVFGVFGNDWFCSREPITFVPKQIRRIQQSRYEPLLLSRIWGKWYLVFVRQSRYSRFCCLLSHWG